MKKTLYILSIVLPVIDIVKGVISGIKKGLEDLSRSEFEKDEEQFRRLRDVVNSEHGTLEVKNNARTNY